VAHQISSDRILEVQAAGYLRIAALFTVTAGDDTRARDPLGATLDIRFRQYMKMHVRERVAPLDLSVRI